ncbi:MULTISPECIES: hypothetical protein [unclassified Campylobacter]|uniref:hypothetical protein n=1 Tax=unclassified Campylobacter TaxID=2593542 RepID=UPI001237D8B2|nr:MULTISPECIES: hypothetical protein [unclassified Campylobacter]KAA6225390.1 hypothetical protein FMM54_06405 [Campylobacter sp. LR185c]KAA6227086.1 hypothetical protein FMM55_03800 [Campylobacter sp. LR196d]KAA6228712.1 hypothetical protein FMM57_02265 [Campylobacter sp. LR286c]KAA6229522.1 hypothetical protein FMM56_08220 [Campylobacter sp. LR264d]KAA6230766.1 hypothetical protein FMM58_04975 [Campylobacter sp. LR291e]
MKKVMFFVLCLIFCLNFTKASDFNETIKDVDISGSLKYEYNSGSAKKKDGHQGRALINVGVE